MLRLRTRRTSRSVGVCVHDCYSVNCSLGRGQFYLHQIVNGRMMEAAVLARATLMPRINYQQLSECYLPSSHPGS